MSYARARLWSGITGVGFFTTLACAALVLGWPASRFGELGVGLGDALRGFGEFALWFLIIAAPLDWVTGQLIPNRFGRPAPGLAGFLARWLRGVGVQALVMVLSGSLILAIGVRYGLPGALGSVALIMLLLAQYQLLIARAVGGLSTRRIDDAELRRRVEGFGTRWPQVVFVENREQSFVGGWSGLIGPRKLVLPASWLEEFSPDQLAAHIARRTLVPRASRSLSVVLALVWNLAGFLLATLLPGAGVDSVAGLVSVSLGFSVWAFLGLLLLPSFSRPAVYAADRAALKQGVPRELLAETLAKHDKLQEDEPKRAEGVETIFHPVPGVEHRIAGLRSGYREALAPWQLARTALYLGWASFSLLARAVHCNGGRPELWVLFPGD